jgi:hypothetical protein
VETKGRHVPFIDIHAGKVASSVGPAGAGKHTAIWKDSKTFTWEFRSILTSAHVRGGKKSQTFYFFTTPACVPESLTDNHAHTLR